MTSKQVKERMVRSVARSMEAEGANYERVLKRMRDRLKSSKKKDKKS